MTHENTHTTDDHWLKGHSSVDEYYKVLREEVKHKKESGASDKELEDYSNRRFMYVANDYSRFIPKYNKLSDREKFEEISKIRKQCDKAY